MEAVFDVMTALAMFLVGLIVATLAMGLADLIGIAGWIVGGFFVLVIFAFIVLHDKLMNFEMKWLVRGIARIGRVKIDEAEAEDEQRTAQRADYYAFLAGAVAGMVASSILSPEAVFDLIPFL